MGFEPMTPALPWRCSTAGAIKANHLLVIVALHAPGTLLADLLLRAPHARVMTEAGSPRVHHLVVTCLTFGRPA